MLRDALKYEKLGLSVIPLRPKGKEPLYPWTEFQKRRATAEEITKWWTAVPNANIGIVTGKISGVAVVDLDGTEGISSAQSIGIVSSVSSITGRGKHLWYMMPSTEIANAVRVYPGVDIRGEGGYVVAPPSISPNGRRYRWLNGARRVDMLSTFPNLFLENTARPADLIGCKEEGWIAKALEGMKIGNIDNTLTSVLGRFRRDGYSMVDARALLLPFAVRAGAEDGHLDEKIENIWNRYEPRTRSLPIIRRELGPSEGLVIHSPTNPDSLKQFEQLRYQATEGLVESLHTGYSKLDQMLQGGLKSERLFTAAAYTNHGKTNFGIGVAKNVCEQDKKVVYFSTEFSFKKIWQRYIATLKDPGKFREHTFYVCDGFTPSLEQVEEVLIKLKPDLFIFDHIQQVSKEKEKLTDFMRGCQFFQRKYDVQGIILSQLNRSSDWIENGKRVEPRLSMLEGSSTIEQASSRVLLLSLTKSLPEYLEISGYLAKNDDGDTGMVQFALYRNPYHLEEL